MSKAPFPVDPVLTGISLSIMPRGLIADQVLPRLTPMGSETFKYRQWAIEEGFTIPDTKVGRKGKPNQVEFTGTEQTAATEGYGLDDAIPQADIDNGAQSNVDPIARAVPGLSRLVSLDREKRVADVVFALATYDAALRTTLSGTDQWSDFANSDPIDDIMVGLDAALVRPNTMVIGRAPFSKLIQHPKINKAVNGTAGDSGVVRRRQIAELFELEDVLVGESYLNTAKKGQTASYSRVWGKHCALIHKNPEATTPDSNEITFGWTAQYLPGGPETQGNMGRQAGQRPDPDIGVAGGVRVRVWENVKEIIVAGQTGYFIQNAVP